MRILLTLICVFSFEILFAYDKHEYSGIYEVKSCNGCQNAYVNRLGKILKGLTHIKFDILENVEFTSCTNQGSFEYNLRFPFARKYIAPFFYNNVYVADRALCDSVFSATSQTALLYSPSGVTVKLTRLGADSFSLFWSDRRETMGTNINVEMRLQPAK